MESLIPNSALFVFFFALIAIFDYSDLSLEQRISIIYISVYAMIAADVIMLRFAFLYLFIAMFCYLEIFTSDKMKLKILTCPLYKIVDCLYLSFSQYYFGLILISVSCYFHGFEGWLGKYAVIVKLFSIVPLIAGIIKTLRQKYEIKTFTEIYRTFSIHYIKGEGYHKAKKTKQFDDACEILTNIEDRTYFTRKAYTCASPAFVFSSIKAVWKTNSLKYAIKHGTKLVSDVIATKRGFSTIQMQLIRTLGLADGYECTFRRKIYEILYARMFFSQLRRYYKNEFVKYDEPFKKYLLYVYFHSVNLWLGKAYFKRFLNPFNMNKEGTQKDIQDCSNEGIFIACMGLSRRASKINENNIDYYLNEFKSDVRIDRDKVLEMVSSMSEAPYDGNYLE